MKTFNLVLVKKTIKEARISTRKLSEREVLKNKRAINFLKKIVEKQLINGRVALDFSNREEIAAKLHCTVSEVDETIKQLSKLDIIFVKKRQRGPGEYPQWLPNYKFMNKQEKKKRNTTPVSTRYKKEYCDMYNQELQEIREEEQWINSDIKENDKKFSYSIEQRMVMVHTRINERLAEKGLTRDDMRI